MATRSGSAGGEPGSFTLWGASEPHTVTQLSVAPNPRSTWSGAHGLSASFSARQYEYFPGWPSVADILEGQAHGATDHRVGAVALAERIGAGVDREVPHDRTVDDEEWRARVR